MANIELHSVIKLLGELRAWDEDMPFQQVQALLLVAMYPGINMGDLADRLNIAQSSTSRTIAALGKVHRLKKEGLDYVEAIEDPNERRRKLCFLTAKGRRAVIDLLRIIYPDFSIESPTAREHINSAMALIRKR